MLNAAVQAVQTMDETREAGVLAERIKQIMEERAISLGELSRKTGLAKSYLSGVLNGRQRDLRVTNAMRIAKALGVSLDDLIGDPEEGEEEIEQLSAEGASADSEDEIRRLAMRILAELRKSRHQKTRDADQTTQKEK